MTPLSYHRESSKPFYGAIVGLAMLVLYEVLVISAPGTGQMIRNAPDAWLRTIVYYLGVSPHYITFLFITAALVAIPLFGRTQNGFSFKILALMTGESVVLGLFSGFLLQLVMYKLFFMASSLTGSITGDLGLAIGAGLFEELFFRVILTTFLIWVLCKLLKVRWVAVSLAIFTASILFSTAHYVGNLADPFELYGFVYRFLAGLWFTALFWFRGFGVVSLTHAFYDVFVILL